VNLRNLRQMLEEINCSSIAVDSTRSKQTLQKQVAQTARPQRFFLLQFIEIYVDMDQDLHGRAVSNFITSRTRWSHGIDEQTCHGPRRGLTLVGYCRNIYNFQTPMLAQGRERLVAIASAAGWVVQLGQTESVRVNFLKAKKYSPRDTEILRELRLVVEQGKALY
jgi:hypothetical protein